MPYDRAHWEALIRTIIERVGVGEFNDVVASVRADMALERYEEHEAAGLTAQALKPAAAQAAAQQPREHRRPGGSAP